MGQATLATVTEGFQCVILEAYLSTPKTQHNSSQLWFTALVLLGVANALYDLKGCDHHQKPPEEKPLGPSAHYGQRIDKLKASKTQPANIYTSLGAVRITRLKKLFQSHKAVVSNSSHGHARESSVQIYTICNFNTDKARRAF